jgi:hypothetical protein
MTTTTTTTTASTRWTRTSTRRRVRRPLATPRAPPAERAWLFADFASRNWLVAGLAVAGVTAFYQLAPAADGSAGLTRWLAGAPAQGTNYTERNGKHLDMAFDVLAHQRTVQAAAPQPVVRYRYPQ